MSMLAFSLAPEAVIRFHDAILCLARFSETVDLDARSDKLVLSTLNLSKSAYAAFSFEKSSFFEHYTLDPQGQLPPVATGSEAHFTCQLYNKVIMSSPLPGVFPYEYLKALLSVFKGQLKDLRDRDTGIRQCDCQIQESSDGGECRFVIQMLCRHGVTKTYKLTYEPVEVQRAQFSRDSANNSWSINASHLRSFVEYFGVSTEQLDISTEDGRATFTSYTEKVMNGKEILKRPMQTSVTVDNLDFDHFNVEEQLHIGIMLKDFKSIASHAESLRTSVSAHYTHANRPMQLSYVERGIDCEFTLATFGDYRGSSLTPAPVDTRKTSSLISRASPIPQAVSRDQNPSVTNGIETSTRSMPPPARPANHRPESRPSPPASTRRESPPPPKPSIDPESLFLPQQDYDDLQWGENNWDEDEDQVGWSAAIKPGKPFAGGLKSAPAHGKRGSGTKEQVHEVLPATQRVSQIEDFFGE